MLRSRPRWVAVAGLLVLGAVVAAVLPLRTSNAEAPPPHVIYVSVTGDGPNAKAWYAGASPVGVAVQDALNNLSNQGYRVKAIVAGERSIVVTQATTAPSTHERTYVILLER